MVQDDGSVLVYASDEMKADKEIVWAAFLQNRWALQHAHQDLLMDYKFVFAAVKVSH